MAGVVRDDVVRDDVVRDDVYRETTPTKHRPPLGAAG
jgi:hypothetical protein